VASGQGTGVNEERELLDKIVEHELDMFLSVPADGEYSCRQHPESFRLHRRAQFSVWSRETLASYLRDLLRAEAEGTNLMTIKYARMGNIIPRFNNNPLIEAILAIQRRWQREMLARYPRLMRGARPLNSQEDSDSTTSFETYLRGELESYSDDTLLLLHRDMQNLDSRGLNGSELVYGHLVKEMGYSSIEEAEGRTP